MKEILQRIKKAIIEERWTVRSLALAAGISPATLHRILKGEGDLNCDQARAIAKVLKLNIYITPEGIKVEDQIFARSDEARREEIRKELLAILRELGEIGDEKND